MLFVSVNVPNISELAVDLLSSDIFVVGLLVVDIPALDRTFYFIYS